MLRQHTNFEQSLWYYNQWTFDTKINTIGQWAFNWDGGGEDMNNLFV